MEQATIDTLRRVNRQFYEQVAAEFSRSRAKLQTGLARILDDWPGADRVLDLGCGDGRFGRALLERGLCRHVVAADECAELLGQSGEREGLQKVCLDLLVGDWPTAWFDPGFDTVVNFSMLHHVPGAALRRQFLERLAGCCRPGGHFAISVWQVLHRERFLRRRVPWAQVGLDAVDVEEGDMLLDWQRGPHALRYVHHFEESELIHLCGEAGLRVERCWRSDGDSQDLGLYLTGSL